MTPPQRGLLGLVDLGRAGTSRSAGRTGTGPACHSSIIRGMNTCGTASPSRMPMHRLADERRSPSSTSGRDLHADEAADPGRAQRADRGRGSPPGRRWCRTRMHAAAGEGVELVGEVVGGAVEGVGRAELAGEVEAVLLQVDGDDRRRPGDLGGHAPRPGRRRRCRRRRCCVPGCTSIATSTSRRRSGCRSRAGRAARAAGRGRPRRRCGRWRASAWRTTTGRTSATAISARRRRRSTPVVPSRSAPDRLRSEERLAVGGMPGAAVGRTSPQESNDSTT